MSEETVNKIIKSCIVSRKGGVPLDQIENDYRELVGQSIPYDALGYRTLKDFISSIDYIRVERNFLGHVILSVCDPKIAHIESLVRKQKDSSNRCNNYKNNRKKRYAKKRGGNKTEYHRHSDYRRENRYADKYNNNNNDNINKNKNNNNNNQQQQQQQVERFKNNKQMEYTRSKWYSDRPKDSWIEKKKESRRNHRYDNFNAGRPSMENYSNNNSTIGNGNDNSWSGKSMSPISSNEENLYNFQSEEEKRYAHESRSWRLRVQVANDENSNSTVTCIEPLVNGHQLIGDDFFLQLAIKNLKAETRKSRAYAPIQCGLCISGQTIDDCRRRLEKTQFLSSHVAILLGAVDIFRGHSLERMVNDMKKLLDVCKNRFNVSNITICTIPPLANYSVRFNLPKLSVLYSFNNWIKLHSNINPDNSYIHHYNVIDLFSRLTDANYRTLYEYFQIDARMVSGCPYPHVLWNGLGRRKVISMLGC